MKKKMILITAVALLLAVVGYGTYAALNASATANNVITMGTVKISLRDEIQSAEADETMEVFVVEQQSEGIWETFPESLVNVQPGSVVNKRVYVKNEGNSNCYVRLKLNMTITPKTNEEMEMKSLDPADVKFSYTNNPNWTLDEDGYYRYNNILAPGEETPDPLYCTIDFDKNEMDNEYLGAKFAVLNLAQGVQSKNNTYDSANSETVLNVQGWPETTNG